MATGAPTPNPRILTKGFLRAAFAAGVTLLALLAVVLIAIPLSTLPPNCEGGLGEPPLSCVLSVGSGDGVCASGNATYAWNCSYQFAVSTHATSGVPTVTLQYLSFLVEKSDGAYERSAFSVTVLTPSGCGLGTYNSSINWWAPASFPSQCAANFTVSAPIQSGDSLSLATIPRGGLPYSGDGDQLLMIGAGEFAGSISASIS
ncbi:MAG: hypothetical protein L3K00_07370 [Thermoplasmata archaeon]|nr:hypothetical protein [Thermoplasmata archaeon]